MKFSGPCKQSEYQVRYAKCTDLRCVHGLPALGDWNVTKVGFQGVESNMLSNVLICDHPIRAISAFGARISISSREIEGLAML
jgi:hypothetical protein